MFTTQDILAQISALSGLPRGNRYSVIFTVPTGVASTDNLRTVSILCDSLSIPGTTLNTVEFYPLRNLNKLPTGYQHDDVEMTFILDGKYTAKRVFDTWLASTVNQNTYRISYADSIKANIEISQLDTLGNEIFKVILLGAFPITVGNIQLGNETEGIHKLSVTFTFERVIYANTQISKYDHDIIAERTREGTDVSAKPDSFEIEEGTTSGATETVMIESPTEVRSQEDYRGQTMPGDGLFGRAQRAVDFVRSFF